MAKTDGSRHASDVAAHSRSRQVVRGNFDALQTGLRVGLLLSPFFLNDALYLALPNGRAEPLRSFIDVATSIWAASLLWFSLRLNWWDGSALDLLDRAFVMRRLLRGVAWGAGLLTLSLPFRLVIWLGGRFTGVDFPFPGAWGELEGTPVFFNVARILFVCLLGAAVEEGVFRGILVPAIRPFGLEGVRLTLVSGGIYALAHWSGGPLLWITAFLFGVLWTVLFQKIGYASTTAAHALFDIGSAFGLQQIVVGSWME